MNLPATALREQPGLRLQPDTAPFEHLVVDSAERPEPDEPTCYNFDSPNPTGQ